MSELNINPGVEIRNSRVELHQFQLRLAIASAFVLLMFALLFARFFYLQVIQHEHYHTLAEANRISIVPIAPNRGIIVDHRPGYVRVSPHFYNVESELDQVLNELITWRDAS